MLSPPRPPPHNSEDSELSKRSHEFRVFRFVGRWAGRAQNPHICLIQDCVLAIVVCQVCHAVAKECEVCEADGPAGLGRAGVGGRRVGIAGVKGLVGGKFASSDCPVFCRGEVGLEVG